MPLIKVAFSVSLSSFSSLGNSRDNYRYHPRLPPTKTIKSYLTRLGHPYLAIMRRCPLHIHRELLIRKSIEPVHQKRKIPVCILPGNSLALLIKTASPVTRIDCISWPDATATGYTPFLPFNASLYTSVFKLSSTGAIRQILCCILVSTGGVVV